ncbi:MAG: hypothetical protein VYD19_01795 [Myxococcota bacterium]|nr:hypothetical protein [Myxococcota bacterium]
MDGTRRDRAWRRGPLLFLFCSLILPLHIVRAETAASATDHFQARVELLTDAPVQLGLGGLVEGPYRIRLATSLGWMPAPYIRGINAAVTALDAGYTEANAELVEATTQNSLVWSTRVGWRPFPKRGFYFHGGYTLIGLGGGATTRALIEGLTGVEAEERQSTGQRSREPLYIDAAATIQLFSLELGWEWAIWRAMEKQGASRTRSLLLRVGLGWSYTFAASAQLEAQSSGRRAFVEESLRGLETAGEVYLVDLAESYLHPPSLTLALGYRFR